MDHLCAHAIRYVRYAEKEARKNTNLSLSKARRLLQQGKVRKMCSCQEPQNLDMLRAKTRSEISAMRGDRHLLRGQTERLKEGQETPCQSSQLESSE